MQEAYRELALVWNGVNNRTLSVLASRSWIGSQLPPDLAAQMLIDLTHVIWALEAFAEAVARAAQTDAEHSVLGVPLPWLWFIQWEAEAALASYKQLYRRLYEVGSELRRPSLTGPGSLGESALTGNRHVAEIARQWQTLGACEPYVWFWRSRTEECWHWSY